jgi:hypothetical protein
MSFRQVRACYDYNCSKLPSSINRKNNFLKNLYAFCIDSTRVSHYIGHHNAFLYWSPSQGPSCQLSLSPVVAGIPQRLPPSFRTEIVRLQAALLQYTSGFLENTIKQPANFTRHLTILRLSSPPATHPALTARHSHSLLNSRMPHTPFLVPRSCRPRSLTLHCLHYPRSHLPASRMFVSTKRLSLPDAPLANEVEPSNMVRRGTTARCHPVPAIPFGERGSRR